MTPLRDSNRPGLFGRVSLARNVLLTWTGTAMTIAVTFLVTPIVVRTLQPESYGVWSFLNSLLVYADLLYLGLGPALVRSVATHNAQGEYGQLNRTSSVVLTIYMVVGLVCAATFAAISPFVPQLFAQPLSSGAAEAAATTACILLGIQLAASFTGSAFSGVLTGLERADLIGVARILIVSGRTIAILALLGRANPLVVLAGITAAGAIIETGLLAAMAYAVQPRLRVRLAVPTRPELRALYGFGLQSFVIVFALTLIGYTDTTVIGVMIGAASVALYALPLQLVEYIRIVVANAGGVWYPRLSVMAHRGDLAGLREAYATVTRVTMFLASFIAGNMLLLGVPFLTLWVGPDFGRGAQGIIVCLSFAALIHIFAITGPVGFFQAMATLRFPAVALIVEAAANLALSVFLAPRLGLLGVALGTLVPATVLGVFVLPPYLWRRIELRPATALRALVPSIAVLAVTTATLWGLDLVIANGSYVMLAVKTALTVPGMALVFFALFPSEDREWVVRHLRRLSGTGARPAPVAEVRAS